MACSSLTTKNSEGDIWYWDFDAHATYIRTCNTIFVAPWQNWVSHAIVHVLFPSLLSLSPLFLLLFPFHPLFSLFFICFTIFLGGQLPPLSPCSAAPDYKPLTNGGFLQINIINIVRLVISRLWRNRTLICKMQFEIVRAKWNCAHWLRRTQKPRVCAHAYKLRLCAYVTDRRWWAGV